MMPAFHKFLKGLFPVSALFSCLVRRSFSVGGFLFLFLTPVSGESQDEIPNHPQVDTAIAWNKERRTEDAIKKSWDVLENAKELTISDSIHLYNILSGSMARIGDHELSLDYAKKSIWLVAKRDTVKRPRFNHLILPCVRAEQYDTAISYLKEMLRFDKEDMPARVTSYIKDCNDMGVVYFKSGNLDSAEYYYKKVTTYPGIDTLNAAMYGLATGNLGAIYQKRGEYRIALEYMTIDAALTKDRIGESYYNALRGLAEIHYELGEYQQAKEKLDLLFSQKHARKNVISGAYRVMSKVLGKLNDHKGSARYLTQYVNYTDSISEFRKPKEELANELSRSRVDLMEVNLALEKNTVALMDKELLLSKSKEQEQALTNRVYFVVLVFAITLLIGLIVYFRNRQKKNRHIHKLETDVISLELQNSKGDLKNVISNLNYKRKFIHETQDKLKELRGMSSDEMDAHIKDMNREFNNYLGVDKNVELLQSDIDKVNVQFFKQLSKRYPALTQNEKELCGFMMLNLASKDIAILKNVTPGAIKKARQRLRKKLEIAEDIDISVFLENL